MRGRVSVFAASRAVQLNWQGLLSGGAACSHATGAAVLALLNGGWGHGARPTLCACKCVFVVMLMGPCGPGPLLFIFCVLPSS